MVCTTAFGMGIDVPNVDVVVRIGCPPSLEELVQEFGRAGRDGRKAKGKHHDQIYSMNMYDSTKYSPIVGILLFTETDVQHALYWCKDKSQENQQTILNEFQAVWR